MFSEKSGLMCTSNYWVLNGHWQGNRDGDNFTCLYTRKTWTITDWVELNPDDLTPEFRKRWYVDSYSPNSIRHKKYFDDDEPPF